MAWNEKVRFRLIQMPCCKHQLCWVNPRLPTYCPECGTMVISKLRFDTGENILVDDEGAWLKTHR